MQEQDSLVQIYEIPQIKIITIFTAGKKQAE